MTPTSLASSLLAVAVVSAALVTLPSITRADEPHSVNNVALPRLHLEVETRLTLRPLHSLLRYVDPPTLTGRSLPFLPDTIIEDVRGLDRIAWRVLTPLADGIQLSVSAESQDRWLVSERAAPDHGIVEVGVTW